jgi:UTP--glucose-1-phosphate uridylyltransferase
MKEGTPKEMLPLGGCPMINYAMREAALSGLKHLYIVINKRKLSLRRYLESDKMEIDLQREISADRIPVPRITFIDQPEPFGSGEAIYRAKVMIGEEPFALMTPDFFLFGSSPALRQVMPLY